MGPIKVKAKDLPMSYDEHTREVTVYLPDGSDAVLYTFETGKKKEKKAFQFVLDVFGDSIKEALADHGYDLKGV